MNPQKLVRWALTAVVVAGLAIDAYVHLHLAGDYALVRTRFVSQATLFRVEGIAAILAAVLVLVRPRWWAVALAFGVAAGGVAAVALYYYVDPGQIGPLPDMYEPVWYAEKAWSFDGEAAAAVAAAVLAAMIVRSDRQRQVS